MEATKERDKLMTYIEKRLVYFKAHSLTADEFTMSLPKSYGNKINLNTLYNFLVIKCNKMENDLELYFLQEAYDYITIVKSFINVERDRLLTFARTYLNDKEYYSLEIETSNFIFNFFDSFNENVNIY